MNLDVHRHIFPSPLLDAARKKGGRFGLQLSGDELTIDAGRTMCVTTRMSDERRLIEEMDERRIDVVALSLMPPVFRYELPAQAALELSRTVNDGLLELAQRWGSRVVPLVHVPLQDVDASIAEISRPGVVGAQIGTHVGELELDDPRFRPFFEAADAMGIFLFLHPYVSDIIGASRLKRYHLRNLVGNVTETAVALASLTFGGVLDLCPTLRLCAAHGGGSAPYLLGRWQHGQAVRSDVREGTPTPVQNLLGRLYYDSLTHGASQLRYLVDLVGPEHVLLGSDGQADMGDDRAVENVEGLPIDAEDKKRILGQNAAELLRL